jgi:hypothetical protein
MLFLGYQPLLNQPHINICYGSIVDRAAVQGSRSASALYEYQSLLYAT